MNYFKLLKLGYFNLKNDKDNDNDDVTNDDDNDDDTTISRQKYRVFQRDLLL